jgi:F-type H+-transporting ATPase subunit epsilon
MADTTNLEIVTPQTIIVSEPVEMVVIPGSDGQIGALPRHSKVISTLDRGLVDIFNDNKISYQIMIDGGITEINETSVTILAERAEKIDKANKQVLEEKLLSFQSQENHKDQNVADLAIKNSSFIKAVLDKIG